jgi:hypothetical protein
MTARNRHCVAEKVVARRRAEENILAIPNGHGGPRGTRTRRPEPVVLIHFPAVASRVLYEVSRVHVTEVLRAGDRPSAHGVGAMGLTPLSHPDPW